MARRRCDIGIDEMTSVQGYSVCTPACSATTATARSSSWRIVTALVSIRTLEPAASTLSRQTSHIIPGPYLGYWNSSISEVMSVALPFFRKDIDAGRESRMAFTPAFHSDMFLMRWAAQSAWMLLAGTPQTFSL